MRAIGERGRIRGDTLSGEVFLNFSAANARARLRIHRIRNLDRGGIAHVIPSILFRNIAVTNTGTFSANTTWNAGGTGTLAGLFHGTGHENFTFDFAAHGMRGIGGGRRFVNSSDPCAVPTQTGSIRGGGARYTVPSGDASFSLEVPETGGLSALMASHSGTATGTAPTADARSGGWGSTALRVCSWRHLRWVGQYSLLFATRSSECRTPRDQKPR